MPRDENFLYSGARSNPDRVDRQERLQQRKQERTELAPQAGIVFEMITKQKEVLGELLLAIVDPDSADDQVQVKLNAVRLHRTWLQQFEMELNNILRLTPDEKKKLDRESKATSFKDEDDE